MRVVILTTLFLAFGDASFCGKSAVPFSFEALPNGQPVLGCARPSCFGWNADGTPASKPAQFYRINKKPDGFFRNSADVRPKAVKSDDSFNFQPQIAECAATYENDQCPSDTNWVGGIGPLINASTLPLALQCCSYSGLSLSQDRGVAVVNPGQIVIGGEVLHGNRQYAFDYISDVLKHTKADGNVTYDVSIRRFPCLPHPDEMSVNVEEVARDEVIRRFQGVTKEQLQKPFPGSAVAFQAPIVAGPVATARLQTVELVDRVVEQPVSVARETEVIEGPFTAENSNADIVEEVQAEEGLELPEGQRPVGLQEPASGGQGGNGGNGGGNGGNGGGNGGNGGGNGGNGGNGNGWGNGGNGGNGGGQQFFVGQPQFQPVQPVGQNYYGGGSAPGYYGGGSPGYYGGGGGSLWCFSADTMVQTSDGQKKRMDEITMDDWLLSINGSHSVYSPMESWVHRMPEVKANFHRIELSDGKVLKLTAKHYIYKTKCTVPGESVEFAEISREAVFAENVEVGDCLYTLNKEYRFEQTAVQKIDIVEDVGIYAPMTANGDVVVNDILASCHNVLHSHSMQKSFFSMVDSLADLKNRIFGTESTSADILDLPIGIGVLVDIMDLVLPKNIHTL